MIYTSDVLESELEVTGTVEIVLFASSTAVDTDFSARLVDVHPDGAAYNICDGILKTSHRDSLCAAGCTENLMGKEDFSSVDSCCRFEVVAKIKSDGPVWTQPDEWITIPGPRSMGTAAAIIGGQLVTGRPSK